MKRFSPSTCTVNQLQIFASFLKKKFIVTTKIHLPQLHTSKKKRTFYRVGSKYLVTWINSPRAFLFSHQPDMMQGFISWIQPARIWVQEPMPVASCTADSVLSFSSPCYPQAALYFEDLNLEKKPLARRTRVFAGVTGKDLIASGIAWTLTAYSHEHFFHVLDSGHLKYLSHDRQPVISLI